MRILVILLYTIFRILLIRHCFYMCILYCCEGRKLDNSLGYYVTFVNKEYCIVLYNILQWQSKF